MNTTITNRFLCLTMFISLFLSLIYTLKFSINVPIADQWSMVMHLDKIDFFYLWEQVAEHRLFFPKLLFFVLARLTHWNIYYEVFLNWLLFWIIFIFLYFSLTQISRERKNNARDMFILAALLIFSTPIHYQSWLWGWIVQSNLSLLFSILSFYLVSHISAGKNYFNGVLASSAALSLFIASFSYITGLIATIIVLAMSALMLYLKKINSMTFMLFIMSAIIIFIAYFYGYSKPVNHPDYNLNIFRIALFFCSYIGVIFSAARTGAPVLFIRLAEITSFVIGVVFFLLTGLIVLRNYKHMLKDADSKLFYVIALILFSALVGVFLAIGREGLGLSAALTSRYRLFNMLFVIGLMYLMFYDKTFVDYIKLKGMKLLLMAIFVVLLLFNWIMGVFIGNSWLKKYDSLKRAVISGNQQEINRIPVDYTVVGQKELKKYIDVLRKNKLTIFNK